MNYGYQYHKNNYNNPINYNDERLVGGGFVFPFLLGGVTGRLFKSSNSIIIDSS